MAGKKCPECKKGTPLWMVSWADMVTLLMCFFIVIVAFSSQSASKFAKMSGSMKEAFGVSKDASISPVISGPSVIGVEFQQQVVILHMMEKMRIAMNRQIDNGDAELLEVEQGFLLTFNEDKVTDGAGNLTPEAQEMLEHVANIVANIPNVLQISTYWKDATSIDMGKRVSPWRAAALQNARIIEHLVEKNAMDPKRLRAVNTLANEDLAPEEGKERKPGRLEILITRETPGIYDQEATEP